MVGSIKLKSAGVVARDHEDVVSCFGGLEPSIEHLEVVGLSDCDGIFKIIVDDLVVHILVVKGLPSLSGFKSSRKRSLVDVSRVELVICRRAATGGVIHCLGKTWLARHVGACCASAGSLGAAGNAGGRDGFNITVLVIDGYTHGFTLKALASDGERLASNG